MPVIDVGSRVIFSSGPAHTWKVPAKLATLYRYRNVMDIGVRVIYPKGETMSRIVTPTSNY